MEDWIDCAAGLMFEVVDCEEPVFGATIQGRSVLQYEDEEPGGDKIPRTEEARARDTQMDKILWYFTDGMRGLTWGKMTG